MDLERNLAEIQELAAELRAPLPKFVGRRPEIARRVALLEGIAASRDPRWAVELYRLLVGPPAPLAHAAAQAVDQIVRELSPDEYPRLDELSRTGWWEEGPSDRLGPGEDLVPWLGPAPHLLGPLVLASCRQSGYLRERAIEVLDGIETGEELPALLVRLSDWVEPVRRRAEAAVARRVRADRLEWFLTCLPLLTRLRDRRRSRESSALGAAFGLLSSPAARGTMLSALGSPCRQTRRAAIGVLLKPSASADEELLRRLLVSSDEILRLRGLQQLIDSGAPERIVALLADRFPPIRVLALRTLLRLDPARAGEVLPVALLDRHGGMRSVAQYHWKRAGLGEARDFYLERLPSAGYAAIRGLGEVGCVDDVDALLPFLDSERSALVRAAIAAVGALDAKNRTELLLAQLTSEHPGPSRAATRVLLSARATVEDRRLLKLALEPRLVHVRRNLARLGRRMSKWEALRLLLHLAADPDKRAATIAVHLLERWYQEFNRSWVVPGKEQKAACERALEEVRDRLPEGLGRVLTGIVE